MTDTETTLAIKEAIRTLSVEFVKVKAWNDKTFKVEVSSAVFKDLRRLDRFELLNNLLKERLPEIFAQYSFQYKPFTKEEWVVRNARKLEK